ncbi:MAG: hypothetical protein KGS60_03425 [Verrucomicrobia bacterium]|nr:hypothetical protein [Verrucomicrobiota bacterium]
MRNTSFRLLVQLSVALAAPGLAMAQGPTQVQAKIADMKVIIQKTPVFTAAGVEMKKEGRLREWLEAEIEFETKSDSKLGVIPEVMVQYYLAVKGVTPQILTDSYTYTNVIDKETSYAVVYVSPAGLTRVNGEMGGFKMTDVAAWGAEILFNGRVVASYSNSGGDWWTSAPQQRVTGLLLPKENTPFNLLWIDRHLEVKR